MHDAMVERDGQCHRLLPVSTSPGLQQRDLPATSLKVNGK
jgi:hypothetical protein